MASPSAPPRTPRKMLSVSSWRIRRTRDGADRRPDRQFAFAAGGAGEQQVRDVCAADQQDDADDADEQQGRGAKLAADERLVQRLDRDAAAFVGGGEVLGESVGDHRKVGSGRFNRHAGFHPPDHSELVQRAQLRRRTENRPHGPHARATEQLELPRDDADDGERHAVETDIGADDGGVAVEPRLPQGFAEHGHVGAAAVVVGHERPAGNRLDAEGVEEPGCDPLAGDVLGETVGAGHHHAADARDVARDDVEGAVAIAPVGHVQGRHGTARGRRAALGEHHQPIRVAERQRTEQRRVDEREDRAVRADAQGERQDRDGREAGLPAKGAGGIAEVVPELGQYRPAGGHAGRRWRRHVRLAKLTHVAGERIGVVEFQRRHTPCVGVARAGGTQLLVALIEMLGKLLDDLRLARRTQAERREPSPQIVVPLRHCRLP